MARGYRSFLLGDPLLAADVDGYLMRQSVAQFATSAARGAAMTPVIGQTTALDTSKGSLYVYDGAVWAQHIPAAASSAGVALTAPTTQSGRNVITTDAGGLGVISFPAVFASAPAIVLVGSLDSTAGGIYLAAVVAGSITTAQFQFAARTAANAVVVSTSLTISWTATGERA